MSTKRRNQGQKKENIRAFLERNKIFFETLTASLLALMAIIVSYGQYRTSDQQVKLAEMQIKMTRAQMAPQFVVEAQQVMHQKEGKALDDQITVTNSGGLAHDLQSENIVFLDVTLVPDRGETKKERIPVEEYYLATVYGSRSSGLVMTIKGVGNNQRAILLEREFREECGKSNAYGSVDVRRYVHLTYKDILGEHYDKYYFVPLIYGGHVIDDKEGRDLFSRYSFKRYGQKTDFTKITAKVLLDRLNENSPN